MKNLLKRLWVEEDGQDLTEYALLIALIGLAAIVAMQGVATAITGIFTSVATKLNNLIP